MNNWRGILLFFCLIGGAKFAYQKYQNFKQTKMLVQVQGTPQAKFQLGVPENCNSKKYCITVYVAPWCPACKATQSAFFAIQKYIPEHRKDVGFGVVVGAASKGENEAEVNELKPVEAYADNSGQIMKNRNIKSFPTWIINDQSGQEIFRQPGGFQITDEGQVALIFKQFLKI